MSKELLNFAQKCNKIMEETERREAEMAKERIRYWSQFLPGPVSFEVRRAIAPAAELRVDSEG